MIKIKDYINLIKIRDYLDDCLQKTLQGNNGYSSTPAENLKLMLRNLNNILDKLESEE